MVSGFGMRPSWHRQIGFPKGLGEQVVPGPHGDGLQGSTGLTLKRFCEVMGSMLCGLRFTYSVKLGPDGQGFDSRAKRLGVESGVNHKARESGSALNSAVLVDSRQCIFPESEHSAI